MTTQVGLGMPKMLPIAGTWALPFALYAGVLSLRVVLVRIGNTKWLGDRVDPASDQSNPDTLHLNGRAHANFIENVPYAFILGTIAELNGGSRRVLSYGFGALLLARILHVEAGLKQQDANGPGRVLGYLGTQAFLVGAAGYSAWLVKGYWGF